MISETSSVRLGAGDAYIVDEDPLEERVVERTPDVLTEARALLAQSGTA